MGHAKEAKWAGLVAGVTAKSWEGSRIILNKVLKLLPNHLNKKCQAAHIGTEQCRRSQAQEC